MRENVTKVVIVQSSGPYFWYKDRIGKTYHVYGNIDELMQKKKGDTLYCVENSFSINFEDVIFITDTYKDIIPF